MGSEHFPALYFVGHGVVKISVVVALLRNKLCAYPLSMVVFGGYVVYQLYRFTLTRSMELTALTVLDLIVIALGAATRRRVTSSGLQRASSDVLWRKRRN